MTSSADAEFALRVKTLMAELTPILEKHTKLPGFDVSIIMTSITPAPGMSEDKEISFSVYSTIEDSDEMADTLDEVLDLVEEARIEEALTAETDGG
jgi:hypothetical protein